MEVRLEPVLQAKLEQMALQSGRPGSEILEDALLGCFDEVAQTRALIERRFDDLENGKV